MTVAEKLNDFQSYLSDWAISYNKNSNNINAARKALGAGCRIAILNKLGEINGTELIEGSDLNRVLNLKAKRSQRNKTGRLIEEELIDAVVELKIISERSIHETRLDLLRQLANPESHDNVKNVSSDEKKQALEESKVLLQSLVKWLFETVLKTQLPEDISELVHGQSKSANTLDLPDEQWENFFHTCNQFETVRNDYILVVPENLQADSPVSEALCLLPWSLVVDLNPKTETTGLQGFLIKPVVES